MFSPGFFRESLGHFRQWLDDLVRSRVRSSCLLILTSLESKFAESWYELSRVPFETPLTSALTPTGRHVKKPTS